MHLLLINSPVSRTSPHARLSPPLGLAYIAAEARRAGHDVEILDLNISGYNPQRLNLVLKRFEPDVVGISAYTETYPNALLIAEQVKSRRPESFVLMGGVHPSILPREVAAQQPVDAVAVGEGERTVIELLAALEVGRGPAGIAGLVYGEGDAVVENERREPMGPDEVGLPARDLLSLEFYENAYNVLTARGGCPYRCPFCSASHVWGGRHLPRSPRSIADELAMIARDYGAAYVFFLDDIFTLRRDWVLELMSEMESVGVVMEWSCGTRVDRVDPELLRVMATHGCVGVQFGVESGAQDVLDNVKGIDKAQALQAVEWAVEAGITTTASFMAPFPQDTEATLRETFDFMEKLQRAGAEVSLSYTTPYPGTVFYDRAEELGLRILTNNWGEYDAKHVVMETANLSAARIDEIVEEHAPRLGLAKTA